MTEREQVILGFLGRHGWGAAHREMLPGDASFRRYHRLEDGARRVLLMDAPPPMEDVRPYVAVARHLGSLGLSAPEIHAEDAAAGLLLIEDFGDDTYTRLLAGGDAELPLYALAVDLLAALQSRVADARPAFLPPYDEDRLLTEAALLVDWYLPQVRGRGTEPALREEYLALWRELLPLAEGAPTTLVLRDYHVDNLMRLPNRSGVAACGLLDFQDAVWGPASYDLVSLLEDARRDVPADLVAAMTARYHAAFPRLDRAAFEASFAMLGAQRNAKIVGIFTRLWVRDGKPRYLTHIPRVWRLIERDLRHPALEPLARWLARHIPPDLRRVPPAIAGSR